jgi:hypothetical protein
MLSGAAKTATTNDTTNKVNIMLDSMVISC